jgi:hypothetical protein
MLDLVSDKHEAKSYDKISGESWSKRQVMRKCYIIKSSNYLTTVLIIIIIIIIITSLLCYMVI